MVGQWEERGRGSPFEMQETTGDDLQGLQEALS